MIEQHYYTKTKEGTMGTVAKSSLVKGDYIDRVLKPFCTYDLPQIVEGEAEREYPPSMMIVPRKTGEMIIGQTVYKNYDETFFTHQYILSDYEKRRFLKEPEKIFGINCFKRSFDEGDRTVLQTLAGLSYYGENPDFLDRESLFAKIGFNDDIFNQLLTSIFTAVASKRKIFIVLNVPAERLSNAAKALLYHVYVMMPWQVTEELGVCTYSGELKVRKNIHITFLDKTAIHEGMHFGKNIIFDLVNERFINIKKYDAEALYLRGAKEYCRNKQVWEKINAWSRILSNTLLHKSERTIQFYGHIVTLIELSACLRVNKPYQHMTPKIRKGLMERVYKELLHSETKELHRELIEITEYLIQLLIDDANTYSLYSLDELRILLKFKLEYYQTQEQEKHCIQIILTLLRIALEHKNYAYVYQVLDEVHLYKETYQHLFSAIYDDEELRKEIIYYLIKDSFKEINTFEEIKEQMSYYEEVESILLEDYYYAQVVYRKFRESLKNEKDLIAFLNDLRQWVLQHQKLLYVNLLEQGEYYFLECIQLIDIPSEEVLCQLKFNRSYTVENYDVIQLYQKLRTDITSMSPENIKVSEKVQQLIKKYYKQNVTKQDFYMIVYAFLEKDITTRSLRLNIRSAMQFLKMSSFENMLDFIVWLAGQEMYLEKETFEQQVIDFFIELKENDEVIDQEIMSAKLGVSAKTHHLNEEIMDVLSPNLMTYVHRYKKWLVVATIVLIIGVFSSMFLFGGDKAKEDDDWMYQAATEVVNEDR